jgi:hypothetical protein
MSKSIHGNIVHDIFYCQQPIQYFNQYFKLFCVIHVVQNDLVLSAILFPIVHIHDGFIVTKTD